MDIREPILLVLGISTGLLMLTWSLWQIQSYWRSERKLRYKRRFYVRIAYFIALIGLADLTKAVRDLWLWLNS